VHIAGKRAAGWHAEEGIGPKGHKYWQKATSSVSRASRRRNGLDLGNLPLDIVVKVQQDKSEKKARFRSRRETRRRKSRMHVPLPTQEME
jgi:hypothetical protein